METQVKVGELKKSTVINNVALTKALAPKSLEATCYIKFVNEATPEIVMTGIWTGKTLKGAIRALERHYKGFKYTALRQSIKQRQEEELAKKQHKEAINVPATIK